MGTTTKTNDITVQSTTPNPTSITLLDKEFLSYLQQQDLINAIKDLALAIKSRSSR